jgi:hypothetical protein
MARTWIDLYQDAGSRPWERLQEQWPEVKRSQLQAVQVIRILFGSLRGRAALQAARQAADPRPLLRCARREARRLERQRADWGIALAQLIRAGAAAIEGDDTAAASLLEEAAAACDRTELAAYAVAARRQLGLMRGGAEGAALIAQADDWLRQRHVHNPARMAAAHVPGFIQQPDRSP